MNVAFDPWIPVMTTDGERRLTSLRDVLVEGERFADLAVRPHERVALMRLFLCVSHAALDGPKDFDEWCDVPHRLPEAAQKYLTMWKDSFELFHKTKPWLQVAGLSKSAHEESSSTDTADWTSVSKLNFSFATGDNTTLFDHGGSHESRSIPLHETTLSLLTYQCFSPGGLISQVFWNGKQSRKYSKDAPCPASSMLHAILRGKNLSETIRINILTYEDIRLSYPGQNMGKPIWEMMPTSFDDSVKVENATKTYIGRLVSMPRLILLHPDGKRMLLGDGLVYPTFKDGFPEEPTATVVIRKNGRKEERTILSYRPEKSIWRELAAIIVKRRSGGAGGPLSLSNIQDGEECDLIVGALARHQATIMDAVESVYHIPARLHLPDGRAAYESEVKNAESRASRLGWAVETYRREVDHGWEGRLKAAGQAKGELKAKLQALATTHYWTSVEKNLPLLMRYIEAIGSDDAVPTRDAWRRMLSTSAREAYRIACAQETPRQMRAFAKGWRILTWKREEAESNSVMKEVEA